MASNKTVVKGLRASQEFFDKCDLFAKAEGVDRNKLIVRVVSEYCTNNYIYGFNNNADLIVARENKDLVEKV
jgi:hypothetical protein